MKFYSLTQVHVPENQTKFGDHKKHCEYLFKDLESARAAIVRDNNNGCYGFCECYYNYMVLEERTFCDDRTEVDYCWQEWYHMPNGQEKYEWVKVETPAFTEQTVGWYA
jgi:hypothetical protein